MIYGIGTDIVQIGRIRQALARHGERFALRVLAESERASWQGSQNPARLLAKRFAVKEAFGKALGTGVAAPATLHAVAVTHDVRGKPLLQYNEVLAAYLVKRGLQAHLSISDESEYVIAFVVIEHA